ncbi:MAG: phospholipid carrier-dependent glycosyltransferase [Acidobacteria bacterium]|nr:MAG: phospholipid carrier-dependent glycosyltransferase [Acidobacteriota bacterium]
MTRSGAPRPPLRRARLARAALLVAAAATFASFLGTRDLWAPDEPKYALAAREMLETGEFLIPHVNGAPYPDKPPLMFWLVALLGALGGGVGPATAVLPSMVAALFVLAGTMRLVRAVAPRAGPGAELVAAGLLLCAYRFVMQATTGQLDMLLCAFTTWAFVLLFEVLEGRAGTRRVVAAWALAGLGTLAKGPVALVLPVGGVACAALATGRARSLRGIVRWSGLAAFVAVVGAWLLPAAVRAVATGRADWLADLLFRQTLVRYAASWHHHQPWWFFLAVPWYDLFPASALLPAALAGLVRRDDAAPGPVPRQALLALAAAAGFAVLFFSIPSGKRGLYLLPIHPLLAALVALDLEARRAAWRGAAMPRAGLAVAAVLLAALAVAVAGLVGGAIPSDVPRWLADHGIALSPWPLAAALTAAALAFAVAAAAWPRRPAVLVAPLVAMLAVWIVLARTVYPAVDASRSPARLVAEIRERTVPGAAGAMIDFRAQFGFYAGRMLDVDPSDERALADAARRLAGREPFWLLLRREHLPLLERHLPPGRRPVVILERPVGDDELLVLASPATPRRAPSAQAPGAVP